MLLLSSNSESSDHSIKKKNYFFKFYCQPIAKQTRYKGYRSVAAERLYWHPQISVTFYSNNNAFCFDWRVAATTVSTKYFLTDDFLSLESSVFYFLALAF